MSTKTSRIITKNILWDAINSSNSSNSGSGSSSSDNDNE
jgi:hypothetical protein